MALRSDKVPARLDDGSRLCVDAGRYPEAVELARRYAIAPRNWYRRRARNVRWIFRGFGMSVILLSASLPIIAAVDFRDSALVITVVSVAVAGLTALRTFFRWDEQWRLLKSADWKLTAVIAVWEADVAALDPADAASKRAAMTRTQQLLVDAKGVIDEEARSFFLGITWPQAEIAAQDAAAAQHARNQTRDDPASDRGTSDRGTHAEHAPAAAHRTRWWRRLGGRQHM